jgi:transcription-repair coupling factor (superfamily II helicase)
LAPLILSLWHIPTLKNLALSRQKFVFSPSDAYGSFVASFPFEETPDQLKTMGEVLADMQSHKPMDRVVCGDVGTIL